MKVIECVHTISFRARAVSMQNLGIESYCVDFPGRPVVNNFPCNEGDTGSIPVLGRSPGEGNGNPFQYSCLENVMDRGAWWSAVHGVAKSRARLSD